MNLLNYIAAYFGTSTTTARAKQWSLAQIGQAVLDDGPGRELLSPGITQSVDDHNKLIWALREAGRDAGEEEEG